MTESFDIVIAGGAVIGSSIATHLARHSGFQGSILVIEPDPTYQFSASALSAGSIRQQFSQPVNIAISLYGIAYLRHLGEHLMRDGDAPDIGLQEGGYLYLAGPSMEETMRRINAVQRDLGADIALLDQAALKARFPYLATEDIALGSYGVSGEGWFDGYGLMQAFRGKARALGVAYRAAKVTGITREADTVTGVTLDDGTIISCGVFINAAGASGARQICALAGIKVPVYAKKRCVFSFLCKDTVPDHPLLIDPSGVWWRPEGAGFIAGYSPDDLDDSDHGQDFDVDWSIFEETIWPALAHRIPAFESIRPGRAWAGHYDMNLLDHNAIVGQMGEVKNAYLACGFSGHGLQQSPAIGRGLAELIIEGRYSSLDLTDLGFERVTANRPLLETNVI